jgi:hypothetical protein
METLVAKYLLHRIIDHFTIALLSMRVLAEIVGDVIARLFGARSSRIKGPGDD